MVMWLNIRCSILFHLLVPGGKWQTVIFKPVLVARRWSPAFQQRDRELLLPPSAVINNSVAPAYAFTPNFSHQRRTVPVANSGVSWSIPTLTQPSLAVT